MVWKDFPEAGTTTLFCQSIDDKRWPLTEHCTPLDVYRLNYILKPKGDNTEVVMMCSFQHKGTEPNWLITMAVNRTPIEWFDELERAARQFEVTAHGPK